jgi:PAS domain-containing protein
MLAEDVDFHEMFRISPSVMALLTADLVFVDANDEFLDASGRKLEELTGHNFFERFPKRPERDMVGDPRWLALEKCMSSGRREVDELIRYDIEDPVRPGQLEERYWSAIVVPVRGTDGHMQFLELSAREVTPVIAQFRAMQGDNA